jgi:hypothetical protein
MSDKTVFTDDDLKRIAGKSLSSFRLHRDLAQALLTEREERAKEREEMNRLKWNLNICPACGGEFSHHMDELGISYLEAELLNDPLNTLADLKRLVKEIFGVQEVKLTNGEVVKL